MGVSIGWLGHWQARFAKSSRPVAAWSFHRFVAHVLPDHGTCRFMQAVALWTLKAIPVAFTHNYAAGLVTGVATAPIMVRYATFISAMADGKQALLSASMAGEHAMPRAIATATIGMRLLERFECELLGGD